MRTLKIKPFQMNHSIWLSHRGVVEHIFAPAKAFSEIARILKPGGAHIFSVPLVSKERPSEIWAKRNEKGNVVCLHEPEYHGNSIR
jgi:SAM-dependent methyltransferase